MKEFFDSVRKKFGALNQTQVDGFKVILNAIKGLAIKHQAYILATVWHETAATMQPIEEYGKGKGRMYGKTDPATGKVYYGRGYVQLTWKDNYIKAQKRLRELGLLAPGIDFTKNPEAVMEPKNAANILVIGMTEGWFTTKKLSDFTNYKEMRKIVNGTDDANLIAGYAEDFEKALREMGDEPVLQPPPPDIVPVEKLPVVKDGTLAWAVGALLAAIAAVAAYFGNGGN